MININIHFSNYKIKPDIYIYIYSFTLVRINLSITLVGFRLLRSVFLNSSATQFYPTLSLLEKKNRNIS